MDQSLQYGGRCAIRMSRSISMEEAHHQYGGGYAVRICQSICGKFQCDPSRIPPKLCRNLLSILSCLNTDPTMIEK